MLQWMKLNPQVARGRLRTKGESRNEMTWKDWKMYVLKKETKRRNHGLGTGGGSPIKISFSSLEEDLLEFLTPESVGLSNIPQGGFDIAENVIELDLDDLQENKENQSSQKRLCKHLFLNANAGLETRSLIPQTMHIQEKPKIQSSSPKIIHIEEEQKSKSELSLQMINIQKEKLALKKDELDIQRQILEVQRSILVELQQMRKTVDTFGHLE
ncbi:uncharacterized protein LOC105203464 isoform X3 [Solenopsis invicta]|nr:uncharacterized protein LOC105203464 isoform X3 [Solenopsis invicta]